MLELSQLQTELAQRNFDWVPTQTHLIAVARKRGGRVFLGVRIDPLVAQAQFTLAKATPASRYDALPEPPVAVDWRNASGSNFVTAIRDQGTCGACVAFATCAVVESRIAIREKSPDPNLDLSEAGLFFCAGRKCAAGWWPEEAMERARSSGIGMETSFPYPGKDSVCQQVAPSVNVSGWDTPEALRQRKQAIAFNGPVVSIMKVYEDFLYYGQGVYKHATGDYLGLHSVAVIGYDDHRHAWIVKNSWRTGWGENGFGYVAYNECGIDTEYVFWDPIVVRHAEGPTSDMAAQRASDRRNRKKRGT